MTTIEDFIRDDVQWNSLPPQMQSLLNRDEAEYNARVLVYYLQNQLEYTGNVIRNVVRSERAFYRQLIQYSSQQMMIFPYHIQRKIVAGLGISPFEYYKNIVRRNMLCECSYDRIPNFTAVDCHQVLGIGRNEYIDLLNTYKGIVCASNVNKIESPEDELSNLLPNHPLNLKAIEPWFIVRAGNVSVEDVASRTPEEQQILDKIIDNDDVNATDNLSSGLRLSQIPVEIFHQLYKRGLVYADVPILETDCISVPTLDGFIMNRTTGDSCETLLYKIFVSLDPRSCVQQLATDLNVGVQFVINAASLFCRLGFAQKADSIHPGEFRVKNSENKSLKSELNLATTRPAIDTPKIAFIFDSSVTAYLMLGNLSANLKKHSVTMFEVGKLTGESLRAFYRQLLEIPSQPSSEQDVGIYYEHAKCFGRTIRHICGNSVDFQNLDLLRCGSLGSLEPDTRCRILTKNYNLLLCMAPLSYEESMVFGANWPLTIGPTIAEISSPWFKFFIAKTAARKFNAITSLPLSYLPSMLLCRGSRITRLPKQLSSFSRFLVTPWSHESVLMDIYAFFSSINDLTMNSPVLVQAYDDRDGPLALYQHFIPLPLSTDFLVGNIGRLSWLKNLSDAIDLSTLIGYLSVILPDGQSPADLDTEEDGTGEDGNATNVCHPNTSQFLEYSITDHRIVLSEDDVVNILDSNRPIRLLSANLGVPLFNSVLNDRVFAKFCATNDTTSDYVCNDDTRKRLAAANASLQAQLTAFIRSAGGIYVENTSYNEGAVVERRAVSPTCVWPLPSRSLCISDEGGLVELN